MTSHSEFVFDSFEYQPFNFIRKNSGIPLSESIPEIVGKLIFYMKQEQIYILEDENFRKCRVYVRDILYIEASGHYLIFAKPSQADKNAGCDVGSRRFF